MRVLVSGAGGQLARALRETWTGCELVLPAEAEFDLGDPGAVRRTVAAVRPEVVVNAGAFTQVDLCEAQVDLALRINGEAVGWLADACAEAGAVLVQVSTDYVFDGRGSAPYPEDAPTAPASVYGRSKLLGETLARRAPEHLVVRTAWLYDAWGRNFFNTMRDLAKQGRPLKVVDDQWGSPTTCRALARQLRAAVDAGTRGLLHATCAGATTWHGFAAAIFRECGLQVDLAPCATADFPRPAPRPAYSVLSGARRAALGIDVMPSWEDALREVVASL